jgi:nucleoside-diphosphate-sugar epimerase
MADNEMKFKKVLVTGGAGYVGSVLVPRLLEKGYQVRVLDLYIYGEESLAPVRDNPNLEEIKGDLRDTEAVRKAVEGCDAVIHLACISNDPSVELDPDLSRTINFEAFGPLIDMSKQAGAKRFIFASSGSVYGVSDDPDVTEEHELVPVSLYNKYKAKCEPVLQAAQSPDFTTVIIRPATICGYSPRQRLDLTVNILTNHAVNNDQIKVFGGDQMRPNLHMQDMVQLYLNMLEYPDELIAGQIFNAAYENHSVMETAEIIKGVVEKEMPEKNGVEIIRTPSDDIRSYHISSKKIREVLNFEPRFTIEDGCRDLINAFREGKLPDSMTDIRYYNIKVMKNVDLK